MICYDMRLKDINPCLSSGTGKAYAMGLNHVVSRMPTAPAWILFFSYGAQL